MTDSFAAAPGRAEPKFTLDGSRHDLGSYWGRVAHFFDMVDLRNIFISNERLQRSKALLESFKAGTAPAETTDAQLWDAKKTVSSVLHPDTGEEVPLAFRMCCFMPVNLPISAGMILTPPGPAQLVWQWLNQSYNAGFNYANRNASVPVDMGGMAASYAVATTTAVGMAWGLGRVVTRLQAQVGGAASSPGAAPRPMPLGVKLLSRGLPWLAVASAGSANALAMRYREGIDGITVYDGEGAVAGTSVAAGRACLAQVALTRVVLPVPILLLPPFLLDGLRATKGVGAAMARSAGVALAVELGVIGVFLQAALPLAVALFPQRGAIAVGDLEPEFRGRRGADGREVATFYYNKGV